MQHDEESREGRLAHFSAFFVSFDYRGGEGHIFDYLVIGRWRGVPRRGRPPASQCGNALRGPTQTALNRIGFCLDISP
jgi:hypothetical protein